eukprot:5433274-Pyramimonas_sp.AAC.1
MAEGRYNIHHDEDKREEGHIGPRKTEQIELEICTSPPRPLRSYLGRQWYANAGCSYRRA